MKIKIDSTLSLLITALCLSVLVACQPARYSMRSGSSEGTNDGSGVATRDYEAKVVFQAYQPPAVDMTWVIDNSGSMTEEAAHVRTNFLNFINSVQMEADLKVALISRAGTTGTYVELPISGPNALQIDYTVWSTDALEITSAAMCPKVLAPGSACESVRNNSSASLSSIAGDLSAFLRPASRKAFVIVTDDETRLPGEEFLSAFSEVWPGQSPIVYAFVGLDSARSPCADNMGTRYQSLVARTSGAAFNICDSDWTQAFQQLANHVVKLATVAIVVPPELLGAEILAVELNGLALDSSQYALASDGLHLDPSLTKSIGESLIRIRYRLVL